MVNDTRCSIESSLNPLIFLPLYRKQRGGFSLPANQVTTPR
jgi:hypothetical protein